MAPEPSPVGAFRPFAHDSHACLRTILSSAGGLPHVATMAALRLMVGSFERNRPRPWPHRLVRLWIIK